MNRLLNRRQTLRASWAVGFVLLSSGCGSDSPIPGLYISSQDGAPRWIADTNGAPAWAPDGGSIAWGDEDGLNLWSATRETISLLTDRPVVGQAAWSPDSTAIAFLDPGSRVLQSLNLQSGVLTPLATLYEGIDGAIRPPIVVRGGHAWSPDGSRIAFICWDGEGDELCVIDSDGSAREQLTTLGRPRAELDEAPPSSVTGVAWSPGGSAVAVAVQPERQGATSGIFRVSLDPRSGTRLTKVVVNAPLIWDSDSNALIYSASVEGRSDVYRLPVDGGKPESLTASLPDGARAPAIDSDQTLAVVSGNQVAILTPGKDEIRTFEVPGLAAASPAWRPGGDQLAFLALPRPIQGYP